MFLYFLKFSFSQCLKGINSIFWCGPQDCPPNGLIKSFLITKSTTLGSSIYFNCQWSGSFCPLISGNYRMIIEGYFNPSCEDLYKPNYKLFTIQTSNKTTEYIYLNSNTCYFYSAYTPTCVTNSYGSLYLQLENYPKFLLNETNSFNCTKKICKNNLKFPNCNYSNQKKINLNLILFLIRSFYIFLY